MPPQSPISNNESPALPPDVVLSVRNVSKKFCRNLRRSMLYGIQDLTRSMLGISGRQDIRDSRFENRTEQPISNLQSPTASPQSPITNNQSPLPPLRKDEFWAVRDINFELRRGECLGLIGMNGSGKSTLLRLLTGIFPPDQGEIAVRGRVGALIAVGAGFHPHLTGRENIYLNGAILGLTRAQINAQLREIIDFAEIGAFIDAPVSTYSSGMRMKLGFSIAIKVEPDLLLIDEVLAVGDIGFKYKCFAAIERILKKSAVVFVSHEMGHVQRISNSVILLHHGQVDFHGSAIAEGIQRYQASFPIQTEVVVTGTGKARISNITVSSATGLRFNNAGLFLISHGEDVQVEMNVDLTPDIPAVSLVVNLLDQGGMAVAQCNSEDRGFTLQNCGSTLKITMQFPKIPLNPGIYRLWIIIAAKYPNREEIVAVYYGTTPFQVTGHFVGFIAFQPIVEWRGEPVTQSKRAR